MIILDNKFAKITYVEEGNYILFEYKRHESSSTEFRYAWNKVGDFVTEKRVPNYISDSRKMSAISPSDQKWLIEVYGSRVAKVVNPKASFTAIVLDKDIFAEMSAKMIFSKVEANSNGPSGVQYFGSVESAEEWIKSMSSKKS